MIVSTGFGPVTVREFGSPGRDAPILALHPLAMSGEIWRGFGEWLGEAGYGLLAPDLPAARSASAALTIESMSEQVAAVLDALGMRAVRVLGMSMGGCVAQSLALSRPELVGALVLADTTSSYGADRTAQWAERARMAANPDRGKLLAFQLSRWFSDEFRTADPEACEEAARIFVAASTRSHVACCHALGAFDVTARLSEIGAPAAVLAGAEDYATPVAMSQTLAAGLRSANLTVLPGVRHLSLIESPQARQQAAEHLLGASHHQRQYPRTLRIARWHQQPEDWSGCSA